MDSLLASETTEPNEPTLHTTQTASFALPSAPAMADNARDALSNPLRILVAHNVSREPSGGMSRIMTFIHNQLAEAGHTVEYFCAEDVPEVLGGRLSRFSFPLRVLGHARRAARGGRPYGIINVHEPSSAAIATFKKLAGNPAVVVTSHGVERRGWNLALEELRLKRLGPSLPSRILYPLTSLWQSAVGLRRADHVFCLNSEDETFLSERMGLPQSKITRIFPAADRHFADAARGRVYGRCERLLFAATWRKNKGIEDLVPAFVTLAERHPELKLKVLGAGVSAETVRAAFPAHLRARVSCVASHSDSETANRFAESDLFILPSLFEGTPLTLMEAMASGLPIVTTATCGMKDVIRDGENGLSVPIRSPQQIVATVERLLDDESLRARLGRAARAEAQDVYTWERVAAPVREVYERLRRTHRQVSRRP